MIIGENVTKKYEKNTVLNNFSFSIADQEKVVLSGKSGIGKTTLIRLICGLERVDSGRLYGYDKREIAYMFQEHRLLPFATAYENVTAVTDANKDADARARDLLEELELGNDLDKMPDEMSGGMKQRVSLARALIYDKPVLILDEPFAALDEAVKRKAAQMIRRESVDKTVILVSHNADDYKLIFDDYRVLTLN